MTAPATLTGSRRQPAWRVAALGVVLAGAAGVLSRRVAHPPGPADAPAATAAPAGHGQPPPDREPVQPAGEPPAQRRDRELDQMLQELRVALPGVQVLFAFLLVAPLNARFTALAADGRIGYGIALMGAVAASALLIAPTAHHRLRFREHDKDALLRRGTRMVLLGLASMAAAVSIAVYVVTDFLYGPVVGGSLAGTAAASFLILWYVMPAIRKREAPR